MGICYLLALGRAWPFETHSPLHSQPKPTAVGNFKQLATRDRPWALSYVHFVATVTLTSHNQCMKFLSSNLVVVSFWPLKLIETITYLLTSNPNLSHTLISFYPLTSCWHTLKSIHKVHPFLTSLVGSKADGYVAVDWLRLTLSRAHSLQIQDTQHAHSVPLFYHFPKICARWAWRSTYSNTSTGNVLAITSELLLFWRWGEGIKSSYTNNN